MPKRFTRGHNWGVPCLEGETIHFNAVGDAGTVGRTGRDPPNREPRRVSRAPVLANLS